jgi:hypothetical protein
MVYKQIAKFEKEENYQLAKDWLRHLINSNEGSCVLNDDRDHYESNHQYVKINLDHKKFEITAECFSAQEEFHLRETLEEKFGEKK